MHDVTSAVVPTISLLVVREFEHAIEFNLNHILQIIKLTTTLLGHVIQQAIVSDFTNGDHPSP